jgi:DNA-binding PadR family transcriptional regulator
MHALSELGIVTTEKQRVSRRQQTVYHITKRGRQRFLAYVDELEAVVRDVHQRSQRGVARQKLATT